MTAPEVTLRDVWQLLCSMDQRMNERFDRIERQLATLDARLAAFEASAVDVETGANLSARTTDN